MDFFFGMPFETFNGGNKKKHGLLLRIKVVYLDYLLIQVVFVDQAVQFGQTITLYED